MSSNVPVQFTQKKRDHQQKNNQQKQVAPKPVKVLDHAGFQLTNGSSFKITFPNGYRVVVAFGPSHACDNFVQEARDPAAMHLKDAQAAQIGCSNGCVYTYDTTNRPDNWVRLEGVDEPTGSHKFQTTLQYLEILNKVAALS